MTRSRRSVLTACGAGLAALAGCSRLDAGRGTPAYEPDRLETFREKPVPRPPAAFPVAIPDAMVTRHRERARTLLDRVPEAPDVGDGAVRERLREERAAVRDGLAADVDATDPLRRLEIARHLRGRAAGLEAAYRAATDAITRTAVADRRTALREAAVAFDRDWTYRGADPVTTAVVHAALEGLRHRAQVGLTPDRAFPADPTSDPVRVAELVRHLEVGHAAVDDADRLRTRYREGLADPRSYRTAIAVAAGRLRRTARRIREDLVGYIDAEPEALPFERSIAGTPLERLYRRATDGLGIYRSDAEEARHRGDPATALIATGRYITVLRALDSVVTAIEDDRVTVPDRVAGIVTARREAIEALRRAWATEPTPLAVDLADWSWLLIFDIRDRLEGPVYDSGESLDTRDGLQVWAIAVTAGHVARAVPPTVADARDALRGAVGA